MDVSHSTVMILMTVRIWCVLKPSGHASIILDVVDIAVVTFDITDVITGIMESKSNASN